MVNVCLNCFSEYDSTYKKIFDSSIFMSGVDEMPCLMKGCCGTVVELDEMIAPAIALLNRKGYYTDYCCSGHADGGNSSFYVTFSSIVTEMIEKHNIFDNLPNIFYSEISDNRKYIIRCCDSQKAGSDFAEDLRLVAEINISFLDLVKDLPDLEDLVDLDNSEKELIEGVSIESGVELASNNEVGLEVTARRRRVKIVEKENATELPNISSDVSEGESTVAVSARMATSRRRAAALEIKEKNDGEELEQNSREVYATNVTREGALDALLGKGSMKLRKKTVPNNSL